MKLIRTTQLQGATSLKGTHLTIPSRDEVVHLKLGTVLRDCWDRQEVISTSVDISSGTPHPVFNGVWEFNTGEGQLLAVDANTLEEAVKWLQDCEMDYKYHCYGSSVDCFPEYVI